MMGDPPDEEASKGDVDHGFGTIDTLLIIAHETAPSCHPSEGAFYDPAAWEDFEALGRIGAPMKSRKAALSMSLVRS